MTKKISGIQVLMSMDANMVNGLGIMRMVKRNMREIMTMDFRWENGLIIIRRV